MVLSLNRPENPVVRACVMRWNKDMMGAILNILNVRCPSSSRGLDFRQQFEIYLCLGVKLERTFQIIFVFP